MLTAIIIVDHGSRRSESNRLLETLATLFAQRFPDQYPIVEPAHMELAQPSIASAYARCAARGAQRIVVCPYFLGPGKHWTTDIPNLTQQAAQKHPNTIYRLTATLGIDDFILNLLDQRIRSCVDNDYTCPQCQGTIRCGHPLF
jgi:sirohydrochlorin ferrochelatase